MGTAPLWTRSRVLIVVLGLTTLFYAAFLILLFLRLPSDGYGTYVSQQGFIINRAVAGGDLQKDDVVVRVGDGSGSEQGREWGFDIKLMYPGVWYHRIFGPTPPTAATRSYAVLRNGVEFPAEVQFTRVSVEDLISRTGILFFLGLVFVLSGLFIVMRRGDDRAGRLMALALLCEGLNLFNNILSLFSVNLSVSFYWLFSPLDHVSFWATFALLLHIFLVFPKELAWFRRHPRTVWAIYALNPLLSIAGGLILGGESPLAMRTSSYQVGYPIAAMQLLGALGLMLHTYRSTSHSLIHSQIRWILWGVAIGTAGWLVFYAIPIVVTGAPVTDLSLAMIPVVFIPISLIFAVTRYRLLEIDRVINRSLVYGTLSIFLVGVYFVSVALISRGLQLFTGGEEDTTVVFLSTLTVALVFALVRDYFQQVIDRTFYPDKLNFQRLLYRVSREMSTTIIFDELIVLLTETIPQRLAVNGATFFVLDASEQEFVSYGTLATAASIPRSQELEDLLKDERLLLAGLDKEKLPCFRAVMGMRVCLPLFSHGHLVGLYFFGPKLSGGSYSGGELEILRTLGHQVAIAVENTRLYHQVQVYSRSLEDLVHQRTRELEQAHETLAAEHNKLDAILNTIADGLIVTDTQGCIILTNPVFESIVGRPATRLIGLSLFEAVADRDLRGIVEQALAEPTQVFNGDVALEGHVYRASACALYTETLRDASAVPFGGQIVSTDPHTHRDDSVGGVVTVLRDVTQEVAVDRMKTDFISTVSHEMRTPLTAVLGFAKLIRRTLERDVFPILPAAGRKSERAKTRINENLDIIESEGLRLVRLINDVLDIAKMEAGKIEWRAEEVDPFQVIRSAVASTSSLAQEKGLPVIVELQVEGRENQANPLILWGDPDRLVQVITNLLSNAIKFTDHGEINVRCSVMEAGQVAVWQAGLSASAQSSSKLSRRGAEPVLLVTVADTGAGIAPQDLPTVFEKFKRANAVLDGHHRGTGLGLPICKEIVEHHGGAIWVESEPGVGSTFCVAVPLALESGLVASQGSLIEEIED